MAKTKTIKIPEHCFGKGVTPSHDMRRVYVNEISNQEVGVVYWCADCGCVQVKDYIEYNGAPAENFYTMRGPSIWNG